MSNETNILALVQESARKKTLFLPHAVRQMTKPDRMISTSEIRMIIETGKVIEDYPEDKRGHSCLILGFRSYNQPMHVVCSPKENYLVIITAYIPNKESWKNNFEERIK